MPSTRKSISSGALRPVNDNIQNIEAVTPGKQVKNLQAELERKDAENKALLNNIDELTNALNNMNLVKEKIGADGTNAERTKKNNKKDKDAPVPAKTAYKYFCEASKQDGVDMRQLWKQCDRETRSKFVAMSDADKARFQHENKVYLEEKAALEMYYQKKKEGMAMELFEAHLSAQAALGKAEADKNGKKKTKKTKKDTEAPKRPTSSYMFYAMEQRELVTKKNPNTSPTEITKILGENWNKLDKGKKGKNGTKKYDDMAAKDKTRYEREKAEYEAMVLERNAQAEQEKLDRLKHDKEEAMKLMKTAQDASSINMVTNTDDMSDISELSTKTKKKKDPNAPKKASTAYIFFCTENRNKIKEKMPHNTTQADLLKEVGRQWKELSENKKEKYHKMASKDKERYAREIEKYNSGLLQSTVSTERDKSDDVSML